MNNSNTTMASYLRITIHKSKIVGDTKFAKYKLELQFSNKKQETEMISGAKEVQLLKSYFFQVSGGSNSSITISKDLQQLEIKALVPGYFNDSQFAKLVLGINLNKLLNKKEWFTLRNGKEENEVMILMSLMHEYKEESMQISQQNRSNIISYNRKTGSKEDSELIKYTSMDKSKINNSTEYEYNKFMYENRLNNLSNVQGSKLKASQRALIYIDSKSPNNSRLGRDIRSPNNDYSSYQNDSSELAGVNLYNRMNFSNIVKRPSSEKIEEDMKYNVLNSINSIQDERSEIGSVKNRGISSIYIDKIYKFMEKIKQKQESNKTDREKLKKFKNELKAKEEINTKNEQELDKNRDYMKKMKDKYEKELEEYQRHQGKLALEFKKIENEKLKLKLIHQICENDRETMFNINVLTGFCGENTNAKLDAKVAEGKNDLLYNLKIRKYCTNPLSSRRQKKKRSVSSKQDGISPHKKSNSMSNEKMSIEKNQPKTSSSSNKKHGEMAGGASYKNETKTKEFSVSPVSGTKHGEKKLQSSKNGVIKIQPNSSFSSPVDQHCAGQQYGQSQSQTANQNSKQKNGSKDHHSQYQPQAQISKFFAYAPKAQIDLIKKDYENSTNKSSNSLIEVKRMNESLEGGIERDPKKNGKISSVLLISPSKARAGSEEQKINLNKFSRQTTTSKENALASKGSKVTTKSPVVEKPFKSNKDLISVNVPNSIGISPLNQNSKIESRGLTSNKSYLKKKV